MEFTPEGLEMILNTRSRLKNFICTKYSPLINSPILTEEANFCRSYQFKSNGRPFTLDYKPIDNKKVAISVFDCFGDNVISRQVTPAKLDSLLSKITKSIYSHSRRLNSTPEAATMTTQNLERISLFLSTEQIINYCIDSKEQFTAYLSQDEVQEHLRNKSKSFRKMYSHLIELNESANM